MRHALRMLHALLRILFVLVAALILSATPVWAACTMSTLALPNGRVIMCTTCCTPGLCQTTCN